jgi:hypothetical protein
MSFGYRASRPQMFLSGKMRMWNGINNNEKVEFHANNKYAYFERYFRDIPFQKKANGDMEVNTTAGVSVLADGPPYNVSDSFKHTSFDVTYYGNHKYGRFAIA